MSSVYINIDGVKNSLSLTDAGKEITASVKGKVSSVRLGLDWQIRSRRDIDRRLLYVMSELGEIENRLAALKRVTNFAADSYQTVESEILRDARSITINDGNKGTFAGKEWNLWEDIFDTAKKIGLNLLTTGIFPWFTGELLTPETVIKWLKNYVLKGDSVLGFSGAVMGSILGVEYKAAAEARYLGGSVENKWKVKNDWKKKEVTAQVGSKAEMYCAEGEASGQFGYLNGTIKGTVGSAAVSGGIGATLFDNGVLSPSVSAKLKAEAAAAKGSAEVSVGTEEFNSYVKGSGSLFSASAEAGGEVGMITTTDENGKSRTQLGAKVKLGAESYVAQGKITGGFTVFGIKVGVSASGKAGGAGGSIGGSVSTGGVSGSISAGFGLGAGLSIDIDWSNFSLFK